MADAHTRHGRGLLVVIGLALIFFALLAMIILRSGGGDGRPGTVSNETLTVLPLRLRIRTEPNARAPVVATASARDKVTLVEDRGAWVRVKSSDGLVGWAERSALEKTAERDRRIARHAAIRRLPSLKGFVTSATQLYAGPGIFYPIVGDLADGGEVTIFTRDHDFYAIEYGTGIAYADVDAIDVSSAGTQLDVGMGAADGTSTAGVSETSGTETAEEEAAPAPEPEEQPLPEYAPAPPGGVYSSVPAGGIPPREIDRPVPRYPNAARRAGIEGAVVVRGIVRRDGTIDNVEVIKDLPYGLGEEARRAVSHWRFRPATYQGEPIDVYYTVTVNFRLR